MGLFFLHGISSEASFSGLIAFTGSSPGRGKVTVAQLTLQVSLVTAVDEYLFLKLFSSVFFNAGNPIRVNYCYVSACSLGGILFCACFPEQIDLFFSDGLCSAGHHHCQSGEAVVHLLH